MPDRAAYVAGLPRKVVAAGVLILDENDHLLVVKPTYKAGWEIPGGCVEDGESARAACVRECDEELGIFLHVGRLLVIEHQALGDEKGDSIMLVYDGGRMGAGTQLTFRDGELDDARFVAVDELEQLLPTRQARRLAAAFRARAEGHLVEMVNGAPVS